MPRSLDEIAKQVQGRVVGNGDVLLKGVASLKSAGEADLVFVEDDKGLAEAMQSRAAAVIGAESAGKQGSAKPLLVVSHPRLAFARAAEFLRAGKSHTAGNHPSAVIARMDNHPITQSRSRIDGHPRVDVAVTPDANILANHAAGADSGVVADLDCFADHDMRFDSRVARDPSR